MKTAMKSQMPTIAKGVEGAAFSNIQGLISRKMVVMIPEKNSWMPYIVPRIVLFILRMKMISSETNYTAVVAVKKKAAM